MAGQPVLGHHLELYPIAGGVSLVTSAIVPVALKHANAVARAGAFLTPNAMRHATGLVGEFIREAHLNHKHTGLRARPAWMFWAVIAYVGVVTGALLIPGLLSVVLAAAGAGLAAVIARGFFFDALDRLPDTRVGQRHASGEARRAIARHMAFTVGALFVLVDLIAVSFAYDPFETLVLVFLAFAAIAIASRHSTKFTVVSRPRETAHELVKAARGLQGARMRRKYDDLPEEGAPRGAPIGLHSVREFQYPRSGPSDAARGSVARADGPPAMPPQL
jgi:hypothetical protein